MNVEGGAVGFKNPPVGVNHKETAARNTALYQTLFLMGWWWALKEMGRFSAVSIVPVD